MTPDSISEAYYLALLVAKALGATPLSRWDGCWETDVGCWHLAINGHGAPHRCSSGPEVPPFEVAVWREAWPYGLISPAGGVMVGGADAEDALIIALRARLHELGVEPPKGEP